MTLRIDRHHVRSPNDFMRWGILVFGLALVVTGCASADRTHTPAKGDKPGVVAVQTNSGPVITPAKSVAGRVASVNNGARFVVLNYPFGFLPALDQRLNVYHQGRKVGEVRISGPQQDTKTVADLLAGDIQIGDEARAD